MFGKFKTYSNNFQAAAYCVMLESYTLSDFVSEHPRFVVINYEQVHLQINHFFVSVVYYTFLKK